MGANFHYFLIYREMAVECGAERSFFRFGARIATTSIPVNQLVAGPEQFNQYFRGFVSEYLHRRRSMFAQRLLDKCMDARKNDDDK